MTGAFIFDIVISQLFNHSQAEPDEAYFPAAPGGCMSRHRPPHTVPTTVSMRWVLLQPCYCPQESFHHLTYPLWVILASAIAIALGTCFGGWQVVDKMAKGITKIRPYQGFCAATVSSAILVGVTERGIPVSSTHAINGAIIGVGATRGKNAVQWKVVREMMTAWIITIPIAIVCALAGYYVVAFFITIIFYRLTKPPYFFTLPLNYPNRLLWVCGSY